jgi:putative Holliday junction resolvase
LTLQRRALGIDYGSVRIGVAVSDPLNVVARGLEVVRNTPGAVERIRQLAQEYDVRVVVVGMPYTLKGETGAKAEEVTRFIERLRTVLACEIATMDERFSSKTAQRSLIEMGVGKKARREKGIVDRTAAAFILQEYLDEARAPHS